MNDEEKLASLQAALRHHEAELAQARTERDQAILKAHQEGMSMYRIAQIIGISQQAIAHIVKARQARDRE